MIVFRAGLGALVRRGTYWYPARLVQFDENELAWTVRWWRGCKFAELWMNRTERRAIRVSLDEYTVKFQRLIKKC